MKKLIEERSGYEKELNSSTEYVQAPTAGIVSYRIDGLENVLTPDSFSNITKERLEELKIKTGKLVSHCLLPPIYIQSSLLLLHYWQVLS